MTQAISTLYEVLGGRPAITVVVEDFYRRVLGDPDLAGFFAETDMDQQTRMQIAFISMALGGPNEYDGRTMHDAHDGLGITEHHFGLVAGHLADALKAAGVADSVINDVLEVIGPLKDAVVTA